MLLGFFVGDVLVALLAEFLDLKTFLNSWILFCVVDATLIASVIAFFSAVAPHFHQCIL